MLSKTKNNAFLWAIIVMGIGILAWGVVSPYTEAIVVLGAAFIIAGAVGLYMMFATGNVAKNLYKRFEDQDKILETHTEILGTHTEILKEIASTQKEIASTQKEIASTLKSIDSKIEPKL